MPKPLRWSLILAAMVGCSTAFAESELAYEDLRVQGGFAAGNGQYGAVTFMAGDIGDRDQHVIDMSSDLGIVLGVRGVVGAVQAQVAGGNDVVFSQLGVQLLGGFGYYVGRDDLVELLAGYSIGVSSDTSRSALSNRDGRYTGWLGELGYYHTFGKSGIQLGVVGGYQVIKDKLELQSGDKIEAKAKGIDGAVVLGYRF